MTGTKSPWQSPTIKIILPPLSPSLHRPQMPHFGTSGLCPQLHPPLAPEAFRVHAAPAAAMVLPVGAEMEMPEEPLPRPELLQNRVQKGRSGVPKSRLVDLVCRELPQESRRSSVRNDDIHPLGVGCDLRPGVVQIRLRWNFGCPPRIAFGAFLFVGGCRPAEEEHIPAVRQGQDRASGHVEAPRDWDLDRGALGRPDASLQVIMVLMVAVAPVELRPAQFDGVLVEEMISADPFN